MVNNKTKASLGGVKRIVMLVALVMILTAAIGGTIAYIVTSTNDVENTFTPGKVSCEINEEFTGALKKDVTITNTGNTEAYIRAAIIVTWKSTKHGSTDTYATAPQEGQYTMTLGSDWIPGEDGYYYYKSPVPTGESTAALIEKCELKAGVSAPEGYALSVEILADAIQSTPTSVVTEKWHVTLVDNEITGVDVTP